MFTCIFVASIDVHYSRYMHDSTFTIAVASSLAAAPLYISVRRPACTKVVDHVPCQGSCGFS